MLTLLTYWTTVCSSLRPWRATTSSTIANKVHLPSCQSCFLLLGPSVSSDKLHSIWHSNTLSFLCTFITHLYGTFFGTSICLLLNIAGIRHEMTVHTSPASIHLPSIFALIRIIGSVYQHLRTFQYLSKNQIKVQVKTWNAMCEKRLWCCYDY
jgi:hypothetical protein